MVRVTAAPTDLAPDESRTATSPTRPTALEPPAAEPPSSAVRAARRPRAWETPGALVPAPVFGATDQIRGWIVTGVIALLAVVTRFGWLATPTDAGTPEFDEKHYVPQAWQMLAGGDFIEDNPGYGLVVHPPVGKWLIAASEWPFGYTPLGWRFTAALFGVLIVVLITRIARRLTRSTFIGAVAGLFAVCDGVLTVTSRVGMLDVFLVGFSVAALSMLLVDRDQMRERMYRVHLDGRIGETPFGPRFGFRWWRFGAGVMLGLGFAVKWSGLYYIAFFALLSVGFDIATRRAYGVERPWAGTLVRDLLPSGASLVALPFGIYFASFAPWFASETSVYRYAAGNQIGTDSAWSFLPDALRSFWYYETSILKFHEELTTSAGYRHPWESKPWTWPMGLRPMLYAYGETSAGSCGGQSCVRVQMLIGTPALWWLALPMLAWGVWRFLVKRDQRWAVVITAYGASFLPWFANLDRQMYYFYAAAMAPFLVIGLAIALGDVVGARPAHVPVDPRRAWRPTLSATAVFAPERRTLAIGLCCFYLALVVTNFLWLWPVLTGSPITTERWQQEIWLPSWG